MAPSASLTSTDRPAVARRKKRAMHAVRPRRRRRPTTAMPGLIEAVASNHSRSRKNNTTTTTAAAAAAVTGSPTRGSTASTANSPLLFIDLRTEQTRIPASLKNFLISHLHRAATIAGVKTGQIDLLIVNDALMADLHWEHKQVEGTTDVLTFDLRENQRSKTHVEVDLILCVDEARRQAQQRGHELEHELLLYAIHGLLHLIGYDDLRPALAAKMHAEEDRILTALGFGAVFARELAQQDQPPVKSPSPGKNQARRQAKSASKSTLKSASRSAPAGVSSR